MKHQFNGRSKPRFRALTVVAGPAGFGLLVACAISVPAQAQWSSLRAYNRSAPAQRATPRATQPTGRGREGGHEGETEQGRSYRAPEGRSVRAPEEHHVEIEHGRIGEMRTGREFFEHGRVERRHWDVDEDRHHVYPWFGINPGMIIGVLPQGFQQIYVGGNPYYYDQGVYYQPGPSGYVVVTPPIGAMVPQLPLGTEAIQVGPTVYYYGAGAFYVQQPQGFLVVTPPPGITVTTLPPGAAQVNVNGMLYYQADGAYFQPMIQGGITVYVTVQP